MALKMSVNSTRLLILCRYMSSASKSPPVSEKFEQKAVNVTVLGADTEVGEYTSLLLKQNPLVSNVYLYGKTKVAAICTDLNSLDTRCRVSAHQGKDGLPNALRSADIVLLMPKRTILKPDAEPQEHLNEQGARIVELTEACSRYAPKAILTVCIPPVSMTLPLVAAIFRRTYWYHPSRIIGSVALHQVRANSLTARFEDLDPESVHVPLIGGPDMDNLVPLFSRATPISPRSADVKYLLTKFKGIAEDESPIKTPVPCKMQEAPLSEAFALNRLVTTMALGLCGDANAVACAFVRSAVISTCMHVVTSVRFAPGGVVHNYGIPKLTKLELELFERSTVTLKKREDKTMQFLRQLQSPEGVQVMSGTAARQRRTASSN